ITGHPIDIAHSSLELLSDPPTAASQAAGITGASHHTGPMQRILQQVTRGPCCRGRRKNPRASANLPWRKIPSQTQIWLSAKP
uniref:Uncharacterized protein n=1 Tax=Chelydra serpentina TaxID=8475 RepID=A0A8C3S3H9_CHESE